MGKRAGSATALNAGLIGAFPQGPPALASSLWEIDYTLSTLSVPSVL